MTAPAGASPGAVWEEEGARVAGALASVHSALVVGRDAEAAAWVALGIARAESARRRVAVADLVGEVAPLQALVAQDDDPHGISDSFLYGVSLNKIARAADDGGNLFVLPSGTEAVAVADVFRSDRWRRLAGGFREVGALLLLVAQADTEGLDALAASVDGVIVAGEAAGALPDAAPPLAVVAPRQRRPLPGGRAPGRAPSDAPFDRALDRASDRPAERGAFAPPTRVPPPARPWARWVALALGALAVAAGLSFYLMPRSAGRGGDRLTPADSARADSARRAAAERARGAAADSAAEAAPLSALTVANPADSARATAFAALVAAANTPAGAALDAGVDAASLPAVQAVTGVLADGAPWYRLLLGAYARAEEAESLLTTLRRRGVIGPESGSVVRAPYALRVADRVAAAAAPARVETLASRGVPVYALSNGDGTVTLYAGAFELPQDAAWLARQLRSAGVTSALVYRTGRSL